jgi:hypothetical protein
MRSQEAAPGEPVPLRGGWDASVAQQALDRGARDRDPEFLQFTLGRTRELSQVAQKGQQNPVASKNVRPGHHTCGVFI